jgi:uncharacterized damage-inducible protein DinB
MQLSRLPIRTPRTSTKLAACLLLGFLATAPAPALRGQDPLDGVWQGYDGEWRHVSEQLIALAEATPEKNFTWRPAPGVRSTSEVYMHIVDANFYLLSVTGIKMPADLKEDAAKTVTSKTEVIHWLKRSLEAVKEVHLKETPQHLALKVRIEDRNSTVDWMYLRIIVHANEHMGQLVAYARMTGIVPPWSK